MPIKGEKKLKTISFRLDDETFQYLRALSDSLEERTLSYVSRKMLQYAVEKHKSGEFEI